jgi:RHS repeat-associated protein
VILAERYRKSETSRACAGRKLASRIFFESASKSRRQNWPQVADLHQEKVTRLGQTCTRPSTTAEERDASGNVTKRFFGNAGEQIAGTNYYYTTDHLGSVREMTDSSGAIRARYDYDPYGRITKVSGDLESDFGYAGYYRHQASGLNATLYRFYDPEIGRWLSRDPLGEEGGLNLYAYVENDPVNWIDPLGLSNDKYVPDRYKHGGAHVDRYTKNGANVGRYRPDGSPVEFKGKFPPNIPKSDLGKFLKAVEKLGPLLDLALMLSDWDSYEHQYREETFGPEYIGLDVPYDENGCDYKDGRTRRVWMRNPNWPKQVET